MRLLKRFFAWIGSLVRRRRFIGQSGAAVVVAPVDTTPNAFTFTDVSGAALSTVETSNTITVAGLGSGVSVAVTVSGGTFSKNGGGYSSTPTTAQNGDTFAVRHTSSASNSTATNTTLTIGGVSDTFTSTTLAAPTGTLAAPTLGYPTTANPPTIAITIPESWQSGNVLKLAYSSAEAMTSPTVLTHTLTDSDTPGSTISISIPTLGGVTYFRAYGNDGADSANVSNIVKWGDSTAPTISTSASQSHTELTPLSVALAANETVTWSIVGGADQLQFDISGSTVRWIDNGIVDYDAPADIDESNTYVVIVRATDLGGNTTDKTITVTVTAADKTADAFTLGADVFPATVGVQYLAPNLVTVAGITAGISIPFAVTNGTAQKNSAGSFVSSGTVQLGDTLQVKSNAAPSTGAIAVGLHLGLGLSLTSSTWNVTTTITTQWNAASGYVLSNGNLTAAHTGAGTVVKANRAKTQPTGAALVTVTSYSSGFLNIGLIEPGDTNDLGAGTDNISYLYIGQVFQNGSAVATGLATWGTSDVIKIEDDGTKVYFYKNGVLQTPGGITHGLTNPVPAAESDGTTTFTLDGTNW